MFTLLFRSGGIVMLLSATHLLILSGSCSFRPYPFNRSVMPAFRIFSHSAKFCLPSQMECCSNYIILNPSLSCLNRSGFNIYLALQPQGFSQCSLSLFSNGVFSNLSSPLFFFSIWFNITHLSKKQLNFTSSLSLLFALRCHSRSQDEILS